MMHAEIRLRFSLARSLRPCSRAMSLNLPTVIAPRDGVDRGRGTDTVTKTRKDTDTENDTQTENNTQTQRKTHTETEGEREAEGLKCAT